MVGTAVPRTTTMRAGPSSASYQRRAAIFFHKLVPHDVPFTPVEGTVNYCSQYGPAWCGKLNAMCRWDEKNGNCAALDPTV